MTPFFPELNAATAAEREAFLAIPIVQAALAGEVTLDHYRAFLTQAYHHVKHTVPLLMACGARLPERLDWLRLALGKYIAEEEGHHEWILNDIRACGGDGEAVRMGDPSIPTELMVAYAYDTIARRNPVGFFGMVLVLEGSSVQLATRIAERLQARLGVAAGACTYLTSHGTIDLDHVAFFERLMDRLDRPDDRAAVVHCARVFYRLYGDIFRALSEETRQCA